MIFLRGFFKKVATIRRILANFMHCDINGLEGSNNGIKSVAGVLCDYSVVEHNFTVQYASDDSEIKFSLCRSGISSCNRDLFVDWKML